MTARHRGFSLIELIVALAILGIVTVLLARFLGVQSEQQQRRIERDLLTRADQALTGFVVAHHRLPCPDSSGDGFENCAGGTQIGRLPFRQLGLPDLRAGRLRYGVLRRQGQGFPADIDLANARDRFIPLLLQPPLPPAAAPPLGNVNGLDFCYELRNAAALASDAGADGNYLHTVTAAGDLRPVAYALASPAAVDADGDFNLFDGEQAAIGPVFASPQRPQTAASDDRIVAVAPAQLWTRLQCGQALAGAGHAHPNAASAATLLAQGMRDYAELMDLAVRLAEAKVASSSASIATATASLAMATATAAIAGAQALLSLGGTSAIVAAAAVAIAANTAALASAIATTVVAADALSQAQQMRSRAQGFRDAALLSAQGVVANARAADAAGLY